MKRNALIIVATTLLLSAVLAVPAGALSAKDWRKQADNICTQSRTLLSDEAETVTTDATTGAPSAADFANFMVNTVKPNYQQVITSIKALPAPKALKAKIKKLLTALTKGTNGINANITADSANKLFAPATKSAKSLGLKVCGAS